MHEVVKALGKNAVLLVKKNANVLSTIHFDIEAINCAVLLVIKKVQYHNRSETERTSHLGGRQSGELVASWFSRG